MRDRRTPVRSHCARAKLALIRPAGRAQVLWNEASHQFVMWMHVDDANYEAARVGVATAPRATGPFAYRGSFRPHGHQSRDLTLFLVRAAPGGDMPAWEPAWVRRRSACWEETEYGAALRGNRVRSRARQKQGTAQARHPCARALSLPGDPVVSPRGRAQHAGARAAQDDDGAAYVAYSSEENRVMHISQLTRDFTGVQVRVAQPYPIYETPTLAQRSHAPPQTTSDCPPAFALLGCGERERNGDAALSVLCLAAPDAGRAGPVRCSLSLCQRLWPHRDSERPGERAPGKVRTRAGGAEPRGAVHVQGGRALLPAHLRLHRLGAQPRGGLLRHVRCPKPVPLSSPSPCLACMLGRGWGCAPAVSTADIVLTQECFWLSEVYGDLVFCMPRAAEYVQAAFV
jgi:hypothetical protein